MIEDFRTIHEFAIKECSACCFSHGGHLIAALQGCIIMIYSTVTFETVTSLKGHAGKVKKNK